jgi:peptidoglycan/xylan/chitin deacetylase (PgdA/CDA1 family)
MNKATIFVILALFASDGIAEKSDIFMTRQFSFPNGLSKALVLAYDDGPVQDRRFVKLLNGCGLKGTFYINSGRLGLEAEWMTEAIGNPGWYVDAAELATLYEGHEIASHTVNHAHLYQLDSHDIRNEVSRDIEMLESLTHGDVESFAYPFGEVDDRIVAALAGTGITNARSVDATSSFALPDNLLRWNPTAHHTKAIGLVEDFLATSSDEPALFMIWGHSWEFDGDAPDNNWNTAAALCERLSGRPDIWYVGAGEFARYLTAVMNLQRKGRGWTNPASFPVWIRDHGRVRRLPPQ